MLHNIRYNNDSDYDVNTASKLDKTYKIPLRWILTLAFVLQIVSVVGLVGYISRKNAQRSVEDLTQQLLSSVSHRVEEMLNSYLNAPVLANQQTRDAVKRGAFTLDLSRNDVQREQYIWQQMQMFPTLSWINIGSQDGDCLGIWRPNDNEPLQFSFTNRSTQGFGTYYATKPSGQRAQQLKVERPRFDPRTRPWYQSVADSKNAMWTPVYSGFTPGTIFIATSQPLYDPSNRFVGVSGIDLSLTQVQHFLSKMPVSNTGQIFIVERSSGLLVSSSTQEPVFRNVNGKMERLNAAQSETPLIREANRSVLRQVKDLNAIQHPQIIHSHENQTRHFIEVLPFSRGKGLDWLIFIVVPEADVMTHIESGNQITFGLCVVIVGFMISLNILISQRLVRPITRLSQASQRLALGDRSLLQIPRVLELSVLTNSFNIMSREIQASQYKLAESAKSLEQKVIDRTHELQAEVDRRAIAEVALQKANHKLQHLAYIDGLTGIANRRSFDERLNREWRRAKREASSLSIILCDVDYFKKYNDTYGHQLGDDCLCSVAKNIALTLRRPSDLVARYGGEEFVILLPNTDMAGAIAVGQGIRSQIQTLRIPHEGSDISSFVTLSFGVASLVPLEKTTSSQLLSQADQALYLSKRTGRDRVSHLSKSLSST